MALTGAFVDQLRAIVGSDGLVTSHEGRLVYECDMHAFYKGMPDAIALPTSAEQVQALGASISSVFAVVCETSWR